MTAEIDGYGLVSEVWDPNREYILHYTDGSGDLNQILSPSPTGSGDASVNFSYNISATFPYDREMTVDSDANGHSTSVFYYPLGMVQDLLDPYANDTHYNYTDTDCAAIGTTDCTQGGQVTDISYPDGEFDHNTYNQSQLVSDTWGSNGGSNTESWSFAYTPPTHSAPDAPTVEVVSLPTNNATATIETDATGNVLSYTDPNGNTTTSMYNDTGANNLDEPCWSAPPTTAVPSTATCSSPPLGSTSYTYDAGGHVLTETDPLGHQTRHGYYSDGQLCWTAPPTVTAPGSSCGQI